MKGFHPSWIHHEQEMSFCCVKPLRFGGLLLRPKLTHLDCLDSNLIHISKYLIVVSITVNKKEEDSRGKIVAQQVKLSMQHWHLLWVPI